MTKIILQGIGIGASPHSSTSVKDDNMMPTADDINILSIKIWSMHAEVASRYTNIGRPLTCFLVGDAAHRFPPAGGFGMNTSLQDAHNLAWKLAMVIRGSCHFKLLNTYETGIGS